MRPLSSPLPAAMAGLLLASVLTAVCATAELKARRLAMPTIKILRRNPGKRGVSMLLRRLPRVGYCAMGESHTGILSQMQNAGYKLDTATLRGKHLSRTDKRGFQRGEGNVVMSLEMGPVLRTRIRVSRRRHRLASVLAGRSERRERCSGQNGHSKECDGVDMARADTHAFGNSA